jgi:hypothetical protein
MRTIGYGIIAQELITIMRRAGVAFYRADGQTPRDDPVTVDFQRLLRRDTCSRRRFHWSAAGWRSWDGPMRHST